MGKAGYCSACQAYVWLQPDGGCQHGHPAASVSAVYEADQTLLASSLAAPTVSRRRWSHPLIIAVAIIAAVVLLVSIAVAVALLVVRPLTGMNDEWKARVERDYPGWKGAGMQVFAQGASGGSHTQYYFTVRPPGRDFSLFIAYVSENGAPPAAFDEVLRPAGKHHYHSASLLDYLEQNYVARDRGDVLVGSYPDGTVWVTWSKDNGSGSRPWQWFGGDLLAYDADSATWKPVEP